MWMTYALTVVMCMSGKPCDEVRQAYPTMEDCITVAAKVASASPHRELIREFHCVQFYESPKGD